MNRCRDSPYVARLVEEFEEGDSTYLVLRYEKGSDLGDYMTRQGKRNLDESEALQIFKQVALGLKDIHD